MDEEEIKSILKQLADSQENENKKTWAVLYWKAKGLKHQEIADMWGKSYYWVQRYMTRTHSIFKTTNWSNADKDAFLEDLIYPAIRDLVKTDPFLFKDPPPPLKDEVEPPEPEPEPEVIDARWRSLPGPVTRPRLPCGWFVVIAILLVAAGYLIGHWPWSPNPTPTNEPLPFPSSTVAVASSTLPAATLQPSVSPLPALTDTSAPPTEAPTPLPTPAFYDQGQPAILRDGVTVTLQSNFVDPNFGGCFSPKPGFVVELLIHNTTGSQFLIRFDPAGFHAQDDSGNTYTLKGAGMYICNAVGPQNYPGRSEEALYVSFAGQIPLSANYIEITVDSLSGVRLVFHKLL